MTILDFKVANFRIIHLQFLYSSLSVVPLSSLDMEENNIFAVLNENKTPEVRSTKNAATWAFDVFGILLWTFHLGPERTTLNFLIPDWIYSSGSQKIIFGLVNHVRLIWKSLRQNKYGTSQCRSFRVTFLHIISGLKECMQKNRSSFKHIKTSFPSENHIILVLVLWPFPALLCFQGHFASLM